jgi:signal transduction histidine kinase
MKFIHSLQAKYLLIIIGGLLLWPIIFPILYLDDFTTQENKYPNANELEQMWKSEAGKLKDANDEQINDQLHALKKNYPKASMFWVDAIGQTKLMLPTQPDIPKQWTQLEILTFMAKNSSTDRLTLTSFIGGDLNHGFMVFQTPRSTIASETFFPSSDNWILITLSNGLFIIFIFISWLFFSRIRKRLVRLQNTMTQTDTTGIPDVVSVQKRDEIGELEQAFNHMILELKKSRKREREEEALRKKLIASISHDLRTPLTTIRGHAYSLHQEHLSAKGKESLQMIENKVSSLDQLIENFLSYTLLSAGKYPMNKVETDMVRTVRTCAASWYPIFEKEGFEVVIDLPEKTMTWDIDPLWFTRILDNLLQNVVRHAKSGKYVSIRIKEHNGKNTIVIEDKGTGMQGPTLAKGAGIGIEIVSLMLGEMNLDYEIISSKSGTSIFIYQ